jgi:hypothetical protein
MGVAAARTGAADRECLGFISSSSWYSDDVRADLLSHGVVGETDRADVVSWRGRG